MVIVSERRISRELFNITHLAGLERKRTRSSRRMEVTSWGKAAVPNEGSNAVVDSGGPPELGKNTQTACLCGECRR